MYMEIELHYKNKRETSKLIITKLDIFFTIDYAEQLIKDNYNLDYITFKRY